MKTLTFFLAGFNWHFTISPLTGLSNEKSHIKGYKANKKKVQIFYNQMKQSFDNNTEKINDRIIKIT